MTKRKILIMGLPGSGKTTLAEKLVSKLQAACDALRHFLIHFCSMSSCQTSWRLDVLGSKSGWPWLGIARNLHQTW